MSLMVEENASGVTAAAFSVERHHVVAPRRAIAEYEDLAPAIGSKVEQLVAGATQEAGEIEVACLERDAVRWRRIHRRMSS